MSKQIIDIKDVIKYFDDKANIWDQNTINNDKVINTILDNAKISSEKKVLDVACGTGVLFPYYLERNVKEVIAIDISKNMTRIAESKCDNHIIKVINDDINNYETDIKYDCIVVYNAFPHFIDQEALISKLSKLLKKDGYLTIANSISRDNLNKLHNNIMNISYPLMPINELALMCSKYLKIEKMISNDEMYQIVGKLID